MKRCLITMCRLFISVQCSTNIQEYRGWNNVHMYSGITVPSLSQQSGSLNFTRLGHGQNNQTCLNTPIRWYKAEGLAQSTNLDYAFFCVENGIFSKGVLGFQKFGYVWKSIYRHFFVRVEGGGSILSNMHKWGTRTPIGESRSFSLSIFDRSNHIYGLLFSGPVLELDNWVPKTVL